MIKSYSNLQKENYKRGKKYKKTVKNNNDSMTWCHIS